MSHDVGGAGPVEDLADLLDGLDDLPVADHVARFEAMQDSLRERLARPATDGGAA
ncbi:MAG: hypothetical protein FWF90_16450 [Promicromonosporaceae bacterium]|nr:hypothetical protein [Promicromonosporaceae bacterium]